ncbi:dihydroorotate dehydrogenase-like protein [Carboxylicivirga mesophila]|uniref:Dihydroorotate dehydrogenase-like protein n=1 Tax=Carboxylicivirga mesophila TaxID=1166478 RepID=A0ABS5KBU0_9BACT|nr:dihydroorotate dehydrogenase-like protein [Carboxylicivirga mesophila]MBS2212455.1 dihydroorotate dehydrogenase-like protein [Carboxylicivirga mesophila]
MRNLETTYLGLPIKNPIVVGSSGLASTIGGIKKLAKAGAAAIVLKSVFEEEIKAEAEQTIGQQLGMDENNLEFYDYYDYQVKNEVLESYVSLIREAKESVDIPIIASINCTSYSEWVSFAHKIEEAGADAIELNIFKLPFGIKEEAGEIEKVYFDIVRKVKERLSIPVGIKLAPYFTNLGNVIHRLSHSGVNGLILFNRFTSVDYDIENDQVITGKVYSNADDYVNSLRWISIASSQAGSDLVASTGIHDYRAMVKMLMAGASSVEVVSAIYKEGPEVIGAMLKELDAWMERRGVNSINEFKGRLSQSTSANPEVFERVQFMRYFSGHKQ